MSVDRKTSGRKSRIPDSTLVITDYASEDLTVFVFKNFGAGPKKLLFDVKHYYEIGLKASEIARILDFTVAETEKIISVLEPLGLINKRRSA